MEPIRLGASRGENDMTMIVDVSVGLRLSLDALGIASAVWTLR